jgi:hypothetical protein
VRVVVIEVEPTGQNRAITSVADPLPTLEALMLHFCGKGRPNRWCRRAAERYTDPVIRQVYETLAADEARHGGGYPRHR